GVVIDDGDEDASGPLTGTITLDVTPANDAPTTTPVTLVAIAQDSGARTITQAELLVNASDTEGDGMTATGLAISAGAGALVDNLDGTWDYTPALNDDTNVSFSYTITDGTDNVAGSAMLDIMPLNNNPTLVNPISDQSATEDLAFSFQFAAGTFNDTDVGDTLSYIAQQVGGTPLPGWLSFDGATRTFAGTPLNADVGTLNIEVRATDGAGAVVADTFDLTVSNVNDAPVLGNNQISLNQGDVVVLTPTMLSATDIDHAVSGLQFTVSAVSGGQFELTGTGGVAITNFTQAQVAAGNVVFVDDGDDIAPAFSVMVGDTVDSVGPQAATIVFNPASVVVTTATVPPPVAVTDPATDVGPEPDLDLKLVSPEPQERPEPGPDPEAEPVPDTKSDEVKVDVVAEEVAAGDDTDITTTAAAGGGPGDSVAVSGPNSNREVGSSMQGLLKSLFVRPAALTAMALQQSLPASFEMDALAREVRTVLASTEFNSSLDRMREGVSDATIFHQGVVGSSVAVTTGLSVGYVAWLVRGGVLLSTALSSLPAWQFIDPLPVLARTRHDEDDSDDSLQSIIEEESERAAKRAREGDKQAGADGASGSNGPSYDQV
ncbi:MAG: cadherin-like domain-containing protein, partial [Sedimenticolaceae bacterium]